MSKISSSNFLNETKNKLVILLYHGVTSYENIGICNRQGKHSPDNVFKEQMIFIKENCTPLSVNDWIKLRKSKRIPKNPVIVTFDDGFKNNFTTAMPILDELDIPAIFYISAGMIGTEKMFWVDILEDVLNRTTERSIKLKLNEDIQFNLSTDDKKFEALLVIKSFCKSTTNEAKERVIKDLIIATKIDPSCHMNPNYMSMNWEELRQIDKHDLFTIGGHSLNHNILSSLESIDLKYEVSESLRILEEKLNHKIFHYSYPEGQMNHYNEEVVQLLKDYNIVCSPSAIDGINDFGDDLFHLKRIMPGFDGIKFPYIF
mgnify:CR=1 FL=1|tara:strand:- start:354 stop:1301 length:948 start_codon:yes stop_codon:yes gene_type:complete